jgi:hypothetical protein
MALVCVALTGCRLTHPQEMLIGEGYEPSNIFLASATLPAEVKRVLVLPLMANERDSTLSDAREALEPLLMAELLKTKRFEVVSLKPAECRTATGRSGWTGEEALPANFFSALKQGAECDAVLFCQLTTFKGYAPLAIGWRMKLVDVRSQQVLWAGDEVFDAGQNAVMNGARRYQLSDIQSLPGSDGKWMMENSPRNFGRYTLAKLLDTMPVR